jgi:hypothetical protein
MASDRSGPPATPSALDAILETIRTAVDASLDEAIAEGVALTGYPYTDSSKPIPLAEELTPDQRRLMEAIATRSGLSFHTVRKFRIPDPVQVRRRWLGIDPPGVLEKIVNVPDETGGTMVAMPLWRALLPGRLPPSQTDAFQGLVPSPLDRVRLTATIAESGHPPYGIWLDPRPEFDAVAAFPIDDAARQWLRETFERLTSAWGTTPSEPGAAFRLRPPTSATLGWDTHEIRGSLHREAVLQQLMVLLLRSGDWTEPDPRFDGCVALSGANAHELLTAMPTVRRDAALVRGFQRAHPARALTEGVRALRQFPNSWLADEIADRLESAELLDDEGPEVVRKWRETWAALERELPPGIVRPLAPESPERSS